MGKDNNNQEFLKKLDRFDRAGKRMTHRIVAVLYIVFTCCILTATVYYSVRQIQRDGDSEQLAICCAMLLFLAAIPVCNKLVDRFFRSLDEKNSAFDPRTMALPEQGTVTLEDALHRMSTPVGVIVWDVICGCVAFSLLFMQVLGMGDRSRILLACACAAVFLVVGHTVFLLLWKQKRFTGKMLRSAAKTLALPHPEAYAKAVEESLKRGVLAYEKELILTDTYILGSMEWDTYFAPVAIPRAQVTEFTFFYRRMVAGGRNSRTVGILRCSAEGKQLADLVLGPQPKAERLKKILGYYQFSWREGETVYI